MSDDPSAADPATAEPVSNMTQIRYALLYDANGRIIQRMSGGFAAVVPTAQHLGLSVLWVDDDGAYENLFRVQDGKLVAKDT